MNIGFIGVGKIAAAIVEGLCTSGMTELSIFLSPRNEATSTGLAATYAAVTRLESNQQVLDRSDIIFIAVRPAVAKEVLDSLVFQQRHSIISLIPLLKYVALKEAVLPATSVSRAIPLPAVRHHNCPIPIYQSNEIVTALFRWLGQPLLVEEEDQLHAIWTLTGLITPFYELLNELSGWTTAHGVRPEIANEYIADMFQSLAFEAQQGARIDFEELAGHARTPNGMNEQAGREIREKGAHTAWRMAAGALLERFRG